MHFTEYKWRLDVRNRCMECKMELNNETNMKYGKMSVSLKKCMVSVLLLATNVWSKEETREYYTHNKINDI